MATQGILILSVLTQRSLWTKITGEVQARNCLAMAAWQLVAWTRLWKPIRHCDEAGEWKVTRPVSQ